FSVSITTTHRVRGVDIIARSDRLAAATTPQAVTTAAAAVVAAAAAVAIYNETIQTHETSLVAMDVV
ncbi:hypothetical protein ElyMa_002438100, partial [Elysia marginata]